MENNENLKRDGYTIQMTDRFGAKVYPKLDTTVIADALDGQENALSADCLKDGVRNITVPTPGYTDKGEVLMVNDNYKPAWGFYAGAIKKDIVATNEVGGVKIGDAFPAGTSVEHIIRRMLLGNEPTPGSNRIRYGWVKLDNTITKSLMLQFKEDITDATLLANSFEVFEDKIHTYPSYSCAAFYLLIPGETVGEDKTDKKIKYGTFKDSISGWTSNFTNYSKEIEEGVEVIYDNYEITDYNSNSWLGNIRGDVIAADGTKYKAYGLLNANFKNADEIEISLNR